MPLEARREHQMPPAAELTGGCELQNTGVRNQTQREQQALLNTEPFLQPALPHCGHQFQTTRAIQSEVQRSKFESVSLEEFGSEELN